MTLLIDLGKISAKGSSNIFFGLVISNVILAAGAIIVARLLGSALYGFYTLSSVPATFLGLCVGFGVRNGIVRYSAQFGHRNETEKVKMITISGLTFVAISSSIFALSSLFLSGRLANFFGRPDARFLMEIYSLTVLTDALVVTSQSIFVGLERTHYYSIILIFQAILKATISPILILGGFGPLGAAIGYAAASLGTCVLGISVVYFFIIKRLNPDFVKLKLLDNLKMLISYGFPLYLRNLMEAGFRTHFLNFLMVIYASNILIGNYKVALNFQVLVSFFAIPISTILLPAFSKLEFKHNPKALKKIFTSSIKYTSLVLVPATAAIIVLSEQMVSTLYGDSYTLAPLYLSLSALNFLYAAFGQYSIPALLSSQGETKKSMILGLANVVLDVPLALILIPHFQIVGLIASLIVSASPTIVLGSLWVRKLYNVSVDWNQTTRILACSFIAGTLTFVMVRYLTLSNPIELVIGFLVLSSSFIILMPLTRTINLDDISNLRAVLSETGKLSRLLEIPLRLSEMLCRPVDHPKEDRRVP